MSKNNRSSTLDPLREERRSDLDRLLTLAQGRYTLKDIAAEVGKLIGKPDLRYQALQVWRWGKCQFTEAQYNACKTVCLKSLNDPPQQSQELGRIKEELDRIKEERPTKQEVEDMICEIVRDSERVMSAEMDDVRSDLAPHLYLRRP
jgi:hypothetical protein